MGKISTNKAKVTTVFELDVYKLAYQSALDISRLTLSESIPKYEHFGGLCDQMRRASRSICANLAEGWGKFSTAKERHQFTRIASGSAHEMIVWLSFSKDLNYLSQNDIDKMQSNYNRIAAMLRAMLPR